MKKNKASQIESRFEEKTGSAWRKIKALLLMLFLVIGAWLIAISYFTPSRAFYNAEIHPLLLEAAIRDQQAVTRAIEDLEALFEGYKGRIEPFVDDLVGYKTRLRILLMMPGEKIHVDGRINNFVSEKFEEHIFSEEELFQDISQVLTRFAEDVLASENRLLMDCKAAVNTSELPQINIPDARTYASAVTKTFGDYTGRRARSSVYNGIATLVASESAAILSIKISGASLNVAQTAGGSAAGAKAGAKAGSILPGKGTVIGFGVGLAVGIIVDWWMTVKFKEKMFNEMVDYIDSLKAAIVHGTANEEGLAVALQTLSDDYSTAQRKVLKNAIVKVR